MTPDAEALILGTTTKGGRLIKPGGLVIPYVFQQSNPNRKSIPGVSFRPDQAFPRLVRDAVARRVHYRDHDRAHGRHDTRGPAFITSFPLAYGEEASSFKNRPADTAIELCKTAAGWWDGPFQAGFIAMGAEMAKHGVTRGYIRPGHENNGPWYGDYYGIDHRLVEPGQVRDLFNRMAFDVLADRAAPATFSPDVFEDLVDGLLEDGDRAVPWVMAFRAVADMVHEHAPGVLVEWNMAHGAAEPSGADTPDADREFSRAIRLDAHPGAEWVDANGLDIYGRGDGRSPEEAARFLAEWGGLCEVTGIKRVTFPETWAQFPPAEGPSANTVATDRQAVDWFQTVWPHYAALAMGHGGFDLEYVQVWASARPEREGLRFSYREIPELTTDYLIEEWYGPDPQGTARLIEPDVAVWGDPEPDPDPDPPIVVDPPPDPDPEPDPDPDPPAGPSWRDVPIDGRNPRMHVTGAVFPDGATTVTIVELAPGTDRISFRFNGDGSFQQIRADVVGSQIELEPGDFIEVKGRNPDAPKPWLNQTTRVDWYLAGTDPACGG